MTAYVFDNSQTVPTANRFAALEHRYDPVTIDQLTELGVDAGWRCLEVGAGGGSIANWLAEHVGPAGSVLATDIDPALVRVDRPNVRVQRHDIVADELPAGHFDLVHARLVLLHLRDRLTALDNIVRALKSGGWLLLDEFDCSYLPVLAAPDEAAAELFTKVSGGVHRLVDDRGGDQRWGLHAFAAMRAAGLVDCGMRGFSESWIGGTPAIGLHRANAVQVRGELVAKGYATDAAIEAFLVLLDNPELAVASYPLLSTWGRRLG
ncbi:class I SAM-dependent methyltransferase [Fodinicola acaciae]|uniref:class I SAM-dependent methyltransferase n=1 Tax=Fodinicola acaciae TaxID=2681555 RepID=UPI0013D27E1B|nr:class I SAM-dependent methyltransferase [Fodinicola acaciae]